MRAKISPIQTNQPNPRQGLFPAFYIASFRFQFGADLLVAWAIEMEVLILGWYVLTTTESAFLLALLGALRFGGTLISPIVGSYADRGSCKRMLVTIRVTFTILASLLMLLALSGSLVPWHVFMVATCGGLLRPADMMLRQSLIADTVPRDVLTTAMGFSRMTIDSSRVVGALGGAAMMATVGIGAAYVIVASFYLCSALLSSRIREKPSNRAVSAASPLAEVHAGFAFLGTAPTIRYLLALAFLVNLTVLSITGGLLPLVAKNVYGLGSTGLGFMVAAYASGALLGSLVTATLLRSLRPERVMLLSCIIWHLLMACFARVETASVGIALLAIIGLVSSFTMVPMSSFLLLAIPAQLRARIMGLRQLAVFGLPVGLLVSGALIEFTSISATFTAYSVFGLFITLIIWRTWHNHDVRSLAANDL
jgi:predicted MFS family arabinose efflux permease